MTLSHPPDALVERAMALIEHKGWQAFRLSDLCEKGHDPQQISLFFSHKDDVLQAFSRMISRRLKENVPAFEGESTPQERLLEILMLRLDELTPYHSACASIIESYVEDPFGSWISLLTFQKVTDEMCDLANVPKSSVFSRAFLGLCVWVLLELRHDDTPDLSKTMAFMNSRLGYLFQYL